MLTMMLKTKCLKDHRWEALVEVGKRASVALQSSWER